MGCAYIKNQVKEKITPSEIKVSYNHKKANYILARIKKINRKGLEIIYEVKSNMEVSQDHLL